MNFGYDGTGPPDHADLPLAPGAAGGPGGDHRQHRLSGLRRDPVRARIGGSKDRHPLVAAAPPLDPRWGGPIAAALAAAAQVRGLDRLLPKKRRPHHLGDHWSGALAHPRIGRLFLSFRRCVHRPRQGPERRGGTAGSDALHGPWTAFAAGATPPHGAGVLEVDGKAIELDAKPGPRPPARPVWVRRRDGARAEESALAWRCCSPSPVGSFST